MPALFFCATTSAVLILSGRFEKFEENFNQFMQSCLKAPITTASLVRDFGTKSCVTQKGVYIKVIQQRPE